MIFDRMRPKLDNWEKKKAIIGVSFLGFVSLVALFAYSREVKSENLNRGIQHEFGREKPSLQSQFIYPLSDRSFQGLGELMRMVVNIQACFDLDGDGECRVGKDKMIGNTAVRFGYRDDAGDTYPEGLVGTTSPLGDGARYSVPYPEGTGFMLKLVYTSVPYARDFSSGGILIAEDPSINVIKQWDLEPDGGIGQFDQMDISIIFASSSLKLEIPIPQVPSIPQT